MRLAEGNMDIRGGMILTPNFRPQVMLCRSKTNELRCLPAAIAAMKALAPKGPEVSIDVDV